MPINKSYRAEESRELKELSWNTLDNFKLIEINKKKIKNL